MSNPDPQTTDPICSQCGHPFSTHDGKTHKPISEDADIERIMSMSDAEIMALATPEEIKEIEIIATRLKRLSRCFRGGWNAAIDECRSLVEKRWPEADDLLDKMQEMKK